MIQSHQSESLCLRVCDGWVGKSKKEEKKKKKKIPCWSPVKIGSANEMKTDQGRRMGEGRTSSWNNNKPTKKNRKNEKKGELDPYTYKDRLLFLFYIDPLKMCPYLSLSIDHDAKKKKSLSLSLPPIEILRTRLISTKSFKRKSIFIFWPPR